MDQINAWAINRDGVRYHIRLMADDESSPAEWTTRAEEPELFEAFEKGLFRYVGVVVSVHGFDASIWSVDYALSADAPQGANTRESINENYVPDLIHEILSDVRVHWSELDALMAAAKRAVPRRPMLPVPDDFPVRLIDLSDDAKSHATCGECGRTWDDGISTEYTPAPSGRCPFEAFH